MSAVSRRGILKGIVGASIVLGFDPASRSWVTEARADGCLGLPALDGHMTTDASTCAAYADDFGHMVHRTPYAVLFPESVQDVVKMVKFAGAHGIKVGSRGRGHTAFGQSQVVAGILVDMTTLGEIHSITSCYADVDAGVVWRDLILEAAAVGLTPAVLTDFTALTVGGTLSVGGINGRSYRHGAQVDNVLELDVVTGEGKLVTCSPSQHKKLFHAVLAGMGLCAIIVRAKIRLIPAKEIARTHRCFYPDVVSMLADLRVLSEEERFDHLRGNAQPTPSGWVWYIEGTSLFTPGNESNAGDPAALPLPAQPFAGLSYLAGSEQVEDRNYFEFTDQVVQLITLLESLGLGGLPHPWLDLFVPDSEIDAFAVASVAPLDISEFLPGSIILVFPFKKSKIEAPLFRVPDEENFFLFDILQTTPPDPSVIAATLQRNRDLYDQARALGGTQYTISAIPNMTKQDWKKHFKQQWEPLKDAKKKHDPDNVLGAGPGVFT